MQRHSCRGRDQTVFAVREAKQEARAPMAMKFGKYLLEKQLAIGGMAEVFLAHQEGPAGFRKTLCIKRILPNFANDAAFIEMFLDEARTAAQLSHPNIVQIYELGENEGSYYIAMEYIRGPSLSKVIRRLKQTNLNIPLHYAAKIIANVCAGLEFAHTFADSDGQPLHLVHRDISPDNVLASFAGAVKMIDFGIAKAKTNQSKTQAGAVKGKFSYMSPEQIMGSSLDGRSDLFSLGIVLYELTTLRKPFGEDADLMTVSAIVNDPPPLPADLYDGYPPGLQSVILHALAKDRRERFGTAQDMQNELERFIHEQGEFLSERDIGNYMTRLFSDSADDVETLRQLGSGVRMKLTGVPVVRPSTRVGAEEETRIAQATGQTVAPLVADTEELVGGPAGEDPDATRLVHAAQETPAKAVAKVTGSAGGKPERKTEPAPTAERSKPAPQPDLEERFSGSADHGARSKKGLYIGVGAVVVVAAVVGLWFALAPGSGRSAVGTSQASTESGRGESGEVSTETGGTTTPTQADAGAVEPDSAAAVVPPKDADAGSAPVAKDAGSVAQPGDAGTAAPTDSGPVHSPDIAAAPEDVVVAAAPDVASPAGADGGSTPPPPDAAASVDAGPEPGEADGGVEAPLTVDAGVALAEDVGESDDAAMPTMDAGIESGRVRVTAEPTMEVFWAGRKQGRTPVTLDLPTGVQVLKLRGAEGLRKSVTIKVISEKQVSTHVEAVRGVVMFETERGVQINFDGVSLGSAPVKLRQAWEGAHSVTFHHPDGRTATRKIEITKSQPKVLVRHNF